MNNFEFCSPTYFAFGKGKENETGKYAKKFGATKVLLHYGGASAIKSGLIDRIKTSLKNENIDYIELGGAQPNPRSGLVYEGIKLCRDENVDFIIAAGGGSTIDSAKAIACGAVYDGDFWDFFNGTPISDALPVGVVLTISAAGSEGSGDMVITHEPEMHKRGAGSEYIRPRFSVLNPELTMTLPPYQTACGITDIMVHVMERYFTNAKDVEITDRLCEGILKTMIERGKIAMANKDDYESRANIMWAGMVAHNNICGVGREQDWATHMIEHELSAYYDCAHGAGLAVISPAWMQHVMHTNLERFVQFAVRVWGCEMNFENPEITAKEGIECWKKFLKSIGMPLTIKEVGGSEKDFDKLIDTLFINSPNPGGFKKLNRDDVKSILNIAL